LIRAFSNTELVEVYAISCKSLILKMHLTPGNVSLKLSLEEAPIYLIR
jgi:hypothetical protein